MIGGYSALHYLDHGDYGWAFVANNGMMLDGVGIDKALDYLDKHKQTIARVAEWFNTTTESSQESNQKLHDISINKVATDMETEWEQVEHLNHKITPDHIPKDLTDQEKKLRQTYATLKIETTETKEQYQNLQTLVEKLASKTKNLQLNKLNRILNTCHKVINRSTEEGGLSAHQKIQIIEQQLQALMDHANFFEKIASNQNIAITDKLNEITTSRAVLIETKKKLSQPLDIEPKTQLCATFFGTGQNIEGIFGEYLNERASTFWFQDLCSQFASLMLGCFGYKTEAKARKDYITKLQNYVVDYQDGIKTYDDLQAFIDDGLLDFSPRATEKSSCNPDYNKKSLHAKLSEFKMGLEATHNRLNNEDPNQGPNMSI